MAGIYNESPEGVIRIKWPLSYYRVNTPWRGPSYQTAFAKAVTMKGGVQWSWREPHGASCVEAPHGASCVEAPQGASCVKTRCLSPFFTPVSCLFLSTARWVRPEHMNTAQILHLSTIWYVEFIWYEYFSYLLIPHTGELIYVSERHILGAKMSGGPDPCGTFLGLLYNAMCPESRRKYYWVRAWKTNTSEMGAKVTVTACYPSLSHNCHVSWVEWHWT